MKNKSNIILGILFVLIGVTTLGVINQWFSIDFKTISKLWPIMIILAGVVVLIDNRHNLFNATSVLLISLAIPFGIYNCTNTSIVKYENSFNFDDFDIYGENGEEHIIDNQTYKVEADNSVEKVKLNINGGAASFVLVKEAENELFMANTKKAGIGRFSLKESGEGNQKVINFEMKSQKITKNSQKYKSPTIDFSLNKRPVWDISFDVGASDVRYDLRDYKVENLKIETGASNLDIKLGKKQDNTSVILKSGVANIKIEVPTSSGCEIKVDGALSSKNFIGFEKVENGLYRTSNYEEATHKINIDADTGLSNIVVKRY